MKFAQSQLVPNRAVKSQDEPLSGEFNDLKAYIKPSLIVADEAA